MAKYVDADAFVERFELDAEIGSCECIWCEPIKEWIENHSTEDVAPVVHAHWIEHTNVYECSKCGIVRAKGTMGIYNYCPHCGAVMDEEANNG